MVTKFNIKFLSNLLIATQLSFITYFIIKKPDSSINDISYPFDVPLGI
jgi:hypothetical protein